MFTVFSDRDNIVFGLREPIFGRIRKEGGAKSQDDFVYMEASTSGVDNDSKVGVCRRVEGSERYPYR